MRASLRAVTRAARERLACPVCSTRGYAVARERTAITSKLWQDRLAQAKAAGVSEAAATRAQEALVPKPPTRTSIRYSFSADENLIEAYRNPWNAVRVGRVLEDLDSLAGNIAFCSRMDLFSSHLEKSAFGLRRRPHAFPGTRHLLLCC